MPGHKEINSTPFAIKNVRLFILFRLFFNSRFYYPVFTILFIDFGLSVSQFAILNAVWAATIVVMEVPSGALADIVGRKKLLVVTGVLMIVEIALLCFAPRGNPGLLFALFLFNRVLSGTAEASASGADEALAFDTLKAEGNSDDWGKVLETQMRFQSITFIIAMSVGAAVYDPQLMQTVADWLGVPFQFSRQVTMRIPLFMTLAMSLLTLAVALSMTETAPTKGKKRTQTSSTVQAFKLTLTAGNWILKTPFAVAIIVAGLVFDGIIRMVITLSSQYYRVIDLPEASFGIIGSALAMLGLFIPRIARKLADQRAPAFNLGLVTALTLCGLWGMTFFFPIYGLVPAMVLFSAMYFTGFFVSHYLNKITASHRRATVLSFKGLSFNLFYGLVGIFYSILLARMRPAASATSSSGQALENFIFMESFAWFPKIFILLSIALWIFLLIRLKNPGTHE